jgi:trigger factor
VRERIRPVETPEYDYDVPDTSDESFRFTATVAVQPKPDVADWTQLEVARQDGEVPADLIDSEVEALRQAAATLAPVDGRSAREGDTLVLDLTQAGETERDYVVELGVGQLLPQLEDALTGMSVGDTKQIELQDTEGNTATIEASLKEIKEKDLPPLDDELAQATSEFETLGELRGDIEARLGEQLRDEIESAFRAETIDQLVEASRVDASGPLVDQRAQELLNGLARSLERRGISLEAYLRLTGENPQNLQQRLIDEAKRSVGRELVLETVADQLGLDVDDGEVEELIRAEAESSEEDPEQLVERVRASGAYEQLRDDLRMRKALDRIVSEVKPIPADLARAREKLWTPEQEKAPADTKLWTPGSKEAV